VGVRRRHERSGRDDAEGAALRARLTPDSRLSSRRNSVSLLHRRSSCSLFAPSQTCSWSGAYPAAVGPLAVRRYDGDGQLDPSFASFTIPNGKVEVVAADDAGLFAGWSRPVPGQDPTTEVVIRRTLWGGTPDPAFGPDGEMTLPTAGGHYFNDTPGPAWMLATGAVVIATSTYDSDGWSTQGALFRMEPPLALGASWTTTKLITTLGIAHVTEEPGGTLLIGSSTARHNGPGYSDLARIGATGVVLTDGPYDPGPMVLLGDGTALAAGTVGDSPVFTTTLSRFLIP